MGDELLVVIPLVVNFFSILVYLVFSMVLRYLLVSDYKTADPFSLLVRAIIISWT